MESQTKADENFHVTANMVLSLARRSRKIFESSEVDEKRQLPNFLFQNLELKDKKLCVTLREPFKMIKDASILEKCPGMSFTDLTSDQFIDGMRKIYELEPFIKIGLYTSDSSNIRKQLLAQAN